MAARSAGQSGGWGKLTRSSVKRLSSSSPDHAPRISTSFSLPPSHVWYTLLSSLIESKHSIPNTHASVFTIYLGQLLNVPKEKKGGWLDSILVYLVLWPSREGGREGGLLTVGRGQGGVQSPRSGISENTFFFKFSLKNFVCVWRCIMKGQMAWNKVPVAVSLPVGTGNQAQALWKHRLDCLWPSQGFLTSEEKKACPPLRPPRWR